MALKKPGLIALFDVDGTLTAPRKVYIWKSLFFIFSPLNFNYMPIGLLNLSEN